MLDKFFTPNNSFRMWNKNQAFYAAFDESTLL